MPGVPFPFDLPLPEVRLPAEYAAIVSLVHTRTYTLHHGVLIRDASLPSNLDLNAAGKWQSFLFLNAEGRI